MYVAGLEKDHPWRLGIQDPRGPSNRIFATVDLSDSTFSTSGDYERFFMKDGRRYQRATARWLARYQAEVKAVTLAEIREVADLLAALPVHGVEPAADLAARFEQRGLHRCADRLRELITD